MKYNLYDYLRNNLPEIDFRVEYIDPADSQDCVLIQEGTSQARGYPLDRVDGDIQVVSYGRTVRTAEDQAFAVYNFLRENFNFTLPATNDGAIPEVYIQKISARNRPTRVQWQGSMQVYLFHYEVVYSDRQNGLTIQ